MKAIHYLMLVCAALAAGLPNLESAFPAAATPYMKGVTAVLVLLVAVLGAVSPQVQPGAGVGGAAMLLFVSALGVLGLTLPACNSATQAIDNSCVAIHLADEACAVVTVTDPVTGKEKQVRVNGKDLRVLDAHRAAMRDAGLE